MLVEIDQVEAFVAIVRRGGFTRAAAALHLSQPAVSRRLELLEREMGQPLFDRTRGGARLTEAGRTFLPHAEALLASMRDGLEAVQALNRADRGTVTLAMVGTLASTTLTARLRTFRHAHPQVRLALRTALSREVTALVRRGDAALGLRYFPDPDPDVVFPYIRKRWSRCARRTIGSPARGGRMRGCWPGRRGSPSRCGRSRPANPTRRC